MHLTMCFIARYMEIYSVPCNSGLGKATRAKPTWKRDFRVPHKQADDQLLE